MKKISVIFALVSFLFLAERCLAVSDSAAFSVSTTTLCSGQYLTVTNLSTSHDPAYTTYTWNFGTGASPYNSYDANPASYISYTYPGTPTIQLVAYNSHTGTTTIATANIVVREVPYVTGGTEVPLDGTITCLHPSVALSASSSFPALLVWSLPSGGHDTASSITAHTAGMYSVTAISSTGCASGVWTWMVSVAPVPSVTVTLSADYGAFSSSADSVRICDSRHPMMGISSTSGYVSTISWNTPAATSSGGSWSWSFGIDTTQEYVVTLTDMYGCVAKDSMYVKVLASPRDSIVASSSTPLCIGDTLTLHVLPAPGYHYLWSNGSTSDSVHTTTWSYYTVTVTDSNGCTANAWYSAAFNPLPYPNAIVALCSMAVASVDIDASYQWYDGLTPIPGATGIFNTASVSGFYKVLETDSNGCKAYSPFVSVSACITLDTCLLYPVPTPTVLTGIPCQVGSTVVADSFVWYKDGVVIPASDTQFLAITVPGYYAVKCISSYGCSSSISAAVVDSCGSGTIPVSDTCLAHPQAAPSVLIGITCMVGSTIAADTFTWYLNGVAVPASDTQYLAISLAGFYSVKATNHWGCSSTSASVEDSCVTTTEVADIAAASSLKIYPNPANEDLAIEFGSGTISVSILSMTGQKIIVASGDNTVHVSVKDLPEGVYAIEARNKTGVQNRTFVKR